MSKIIKKAQKLNECKNIDGVDLEEYNKDIETTMKEIDNGEYIEHEKIIKILLK